MKEPALLDKLNHAILDGAEESTPAAVAEPPLPDLYYDGTSFYIPNKSGGWVKVDKRSARDFLVTQGFSSRRADDEVQSQVDVTLVRIQTEHDVAYVGALAGHPAGCHLMNGVRVLATSSPKFVDPAPGEFTIILGLLQNLLGENQLPFFYSWLKVAMDMFGTRSWQPGQVLALCGPVGAGKNLLRLIVTALLGGRVAFPNAHMIGQTNFNSDLFSAETLAIEDEQASNDIRARRKFGAAIKNFAVNQDQRCEGKHREPLTLRVFRRLIISMNDDAECIQVLPPLDHHVADKLMLFKVERRPMPMPTSSASEKAVFWQAIEKELPMFAHFLNEWEIPDSLRDSRYGVRYFHHPDLEDELRETSPEGVLLELIDDVIFPKDRPEFWEGTASVLEAELTSESSRCSLKARKLLAHPNSCGTYLGRLERQYADTVERRTESGRTVWKLYNLKWIEKRQDRQLRRR